jgi:DNA-binding NarL/FixJ family response regulator
MSKIRVLIVDDHPFFRAGLMEWLNQQDCVTCCGEAGSVAEARRAVAELLPDVILMDLRLGDGEGLELIRELTPHHPQIRFLALSQLEEGLYAHRALQAGACGYLMKSEATETVLSAIQTVMRGGTHLSQSVACRLAQNLFPDPASLSPGLVGLSDRQLQVFQLLGAGRSTVQIGAYLKISPKTVETYRDQLKVKLGLPNGPALVRAAVIWADTGQLETGALPTARQPRKKG